MHLDEKLAWRVVAAARDSLVGGKDIPAGHISDMVLRSWKRSQKHGLSYRDQGLYRPIDRMEQQRTLHENERLLRYASPEMEHLHAALGTRHWVIVCTNVEGVVAGSISHPEARDSSLGRALRVAMCLGEQAVGTTAPGLALVERRPAVINYNEHFLTDAQEFFCSAVPIFAPDGELIGALNASAALGGETADVLDLLKVSVNVIEGKMARALPGEIHICCHVRDDLLNTPTEGVLVFSAEGKLLGATHSARRLLKLGSTDDRLSFHTIFEDGFTDVVDRLRRNDHRPVTARRRDDSRILLRLDDHAAEPKRYAPARPPTRTQTATSSPRAELPLDPSLRRQVERAGKVLDHDLPILLNGETGTGKEMIARLLHEQGRRRHHPFIPVNCASIPAGLIESELFGYEDGAFTGGRRGGAPGKFELANHGTILLDEIGDMPLDLQGRLLRVLQDRTTTRLGSAKLLPLNVSIIAATHHDLEALVAGKKFREDLFYRLNGFRLVLPPLREREDLGDLIGHMLAGSLGGHRAPSLSAEARAALFRYTWPGNVRQLSHVIRLAAILAEDEGEIGLHHLPEAIVGHAQAPAKCTEQPVGALREAEAAAIRAALARHSGNIAAAARDLGIGRTTLYRKLADLGLSKKA